MPGRFKDFVAMPKLNRYRSLHTTVIGPEGRPLEIQVRTREMHEEAEYGVAAHWLYKRGRATKTDDEWITWVKSLMDGQAEEQDPGEYMRSLRTDLFAEEVYVFTPKGEVKVLPSGATPIDFAYAVHTDVGHRTVGAKVNGRIVPLHYRLRSGDFVEILTSKSGRGPSRDWLALVTSSRARNKIRQWYQRETRGETEAKGRDLLDQALKAQKLPYRKLQGSPVLAQVIRETGFKKAEDFYVALGAGKLSPTQIVNKVIQRLKTDEVASEPLSGRSRLAHGRRSPATASGSTCSASRTSWCGSRSAAHLCPAIRSSATSRWGGASRCTARTAPTSARSSATPSGSRTSSGRGARRRASSSRSQSTPWDRARLLEDVARTFAEHGANIVSYGGTVEDGMAKNWYTAEVGEVKELRSLLTALRNLDAVFDAYRVTPS